MVRDTQHSDFLVIGSGIAGLFFALKAARHGTVAIITKKQDYESNSNYAQGGIAAVIDPADSYASHISDTLKSGDGLCNRKTVGVVVREGPALISELLDLGVPFDRRTGRSGAGLSLGREGGHTNNRIVHATDFTGEMIERTLIGRIKKHKNIRLHENHCAIELITEHHIRRLRKKTSLSRRHCWGAYALDTRRNRVKTFLARTTLLSSGGVGQVYRHTTNPPIATGDGLAMAYRAGAKIADLEFMQFHPTAFYTRKNEERSFLISEAVRGHGGILRTMDGEPFMKRYHPKGDLATRDIVARAIDKELKTRGDDYVMLDITHLPSAGIRKRFPNIYRQCLANNTDMTKQPVWVTPAAHYMCGGVCTDLHGRTTIQNLYACGEVAHTGLHGGNRLASNSLLEALVFAERSLRHAAGHQVPADSIPAVPAWNDKGTRPAREWVLMRHTKREIQEIMWDFVGIVRSRQRLLQAQRRLDLINTEIQKFYRKTRVSLQLLELRNLAKTARLIVQCALKRKESRGLHYILDHPKKRAACRKNTYLQRRKDDD